MSNWLHVFFVASIAVIVIAALCICQELRAIRKILQARWDYDRTLYTANLCYGRLTQRRFASAVRGPLQTPAPLADTFPVPPEWQKSDQGQGKPS